MAGLPMDTPVFTEIGPRAIASLEDEPLITPHSDTAEEAYWRMIDAFSNIRDVVRNYPEIGALPFDMPKRTDEAEGLISSTESRIPKALLTPADQVAVEVALRVMRTELKMLVLHHMFILNWEVSAQLGPDKAWLRLPFGLLENDLCQIDASWRSGNFGGLPLTNICVHRHDIGAPDSGRFIADSSVPQKLPILLNRDLLIYQHTHQSSAPTAAQSRTVAGFLSSEISYFPKRIDSQHPGKIYAQVLREPPRARGRPKIIGVTESVFLSIWQPELSNASQKFVFGRMIDAWPDEVKKVWRQMLREGFDVARCTVERLMRELQLRGVVRGKKARTTVPDPSAPRPRDKMNRAFHAPAPNRLWVSDFTDVSTWSGFIYVAFVIDVFARRIVGWRVSRTAHAAFVLDALEQALHARRPCADSGLVHHSDRGSQYVSIRYTERLSEAGLEPSVGSVGDSYDNALAETIIGLFKTEVIHRRGPWKFFDAVEYATLEWVDWFNNRTLLGPIGHIPPAEAEANYYTAIKETDMAA